MKLLTNAIRFVSEHNNHEKPEKKLDERKQEQDDNDSDNDNKII